MKTTGNNKSHHHGLKALTTGVALTIMSSAAFADEHWPDLPTGLKSGVEAQTSNQLVVGLGSLGTSVYRLNINNRAQGWTEGAPFIGPSTNGAAHTTVDGSLFVFSGSGKQHADDPAPVIFDTVYRYDIEADQWHQVRTRTPAGLSGAQAVPMGDGVIAIFGGYNKQLFDAYLAQVTGIDAKAEPEKWNAVVDGYMSRPPEGYYWNKEILTYDTRNNTWSTLGTSPYLPNCDAATAWLGDSLYIISGEIKPGLRTPAVKRVAFTDTGVQWASVNDLPPAPGMSEQEGIAGAFAGSHNGALIVSGGANFHGAWAAARSGQWFAHQGLSKAYNPETYVYDGQNWQVSTSLPEGTAYGAAFQLEEGVLFVGGEKAGGEASTSALLAQWNGSEVTFTD